MNESPPSWLVPYLPRFEELYRELALVEGFILSPVEVYGPDIGRALGEWLRQQGRDIVIIEPRDEQEWRGLAATLLGSQVGPKSVVLVLGRRDIAPGQLAGLRLLNQRRDSIVSHLRCPLLWCGPREFLNATWENAPDFWSIRGLGYRFQVQAEVPLSEAPRWSGMPETEAPERLRELYEAARSQGDFRNALRISRRLAQAEAWRGNTEEALAILERALRELSPKAEDPESQRDRAVILLDMSDLLVMRGEPDDALRILRDDVHPVFERLGDTYERAATQGRIADILQAKGEWDEALRIRRDEELPAYERLGDVRSRAVTQGRIADILQQRGELDEALRIRREEELPVFEKLGDVRERAVTQEKITDILMARGELDEALRIRREDVLPAFEKLGSVRDRAVGLSGIADILRIQGALDEALHIYRDEVLPVVEHSRNARDRAVTQGRIADILQRRGELDEALRIRREEELPVFEKLGDVLACAVTQGQIAVILETRGELDEALRIRRDEQLPVYEKLGLVRALLVGRANLGILYLKRNQPGDREAAAHLLKLAYEAAEALRLPEAEQIRQVQELAGLKL